MSYVNCQLCPRRCCADRTAGELGFCGCPDEALVAKTMLHKWEEPALAGSGGSGAIFFGGCIRTSADMTPRILPRMEKSFLPRQTYPYA